MEAAAGHGHNRQGWEKLPQLLAWHAGGGWYKGSRLPALDRLAVDIPLLVHMYLCRLYAFDIHCNSYFPLFVSLYGERQCMGYCRVGRAPSEQGRHVVRGLPRCLPHSRPALPSPSARLPFVCLPLLVAAMVHFPFPLTISLALYPLPIALNNSAVVSPLRCPFLPLLCCSCC